MNSKFNPFRFSSIRQFQLILLLLVLLVSMSGAAQPPGACKIMGFIAEEQQEIERARMFGLAGQLSTPWKFSMLIKLLRGVLPSGTANLKDEKGRPIQISVQFSSPDAANGYVMITLADITSARSQVAPGEFPFKKYVTFMATTNKGFLSQNEIIKHRFDNNTLIFVTENKSPEAGDDPFASMALTVDKKLRVKNLTLSNYGRRILGMGGTKLSVDFP